MDRALHSLGSGLILILISHAAGLTGSRNLYNLGSFCVCENFWVPVPRVCQIRNLTLVTLQFALLSNNHFNNSKSPSFLSPFLSELSKLQQGTLFDRHLTPP